MNTGIKFNCFFRFYPFSSAVTKFVLFSSGTAFEISVNIDLLSNS